MLDSSYRYSRWDGAQDVFDMDAEELMDRLSGEILNHGDLWKALRDLMRRGAQDRQGERVPGLRDLLDRLKDRRQQHLRQYDMDSVVDDLRERLEEILGAERRGIESRLDQARREVRGAEGPERAEKESLGKLLEERARHNLEKLDGLPQDVGGTIRELMEYDFIDPEAQRMFMELLEMLKSQMAQNFSQDMMQRIQGMSSEEMEGLREMLRQFNRMLQDRAEGREPDFQGFMDRFGPMFGPNPPQSLDELMDRLMAQMARMQSLMESMSPEARRELQDALGASLDPETERELAQLASLMEQLMPMDELRRQYPFLGDDSLTMDRAMELMGDLQGMDELERSLREAMNTGNLDDVDPERLAELLGEDARRSWEQLQRLIDMLREQGYISGADEPELTPRAIRRIGQKALKEVFLNLKKDRIGNHELTSRGNAGEAVSDTKPYEFGDPLQLDLQATVKNAIVRAGPQIPVRLTPQDFEVYRNDELTRAATVVLLDQSRSMGLFGSFQAAKKVALALFALIHSRFPRDSLYVVGFSDYALEVREEDLAKLTWNAWVSGTNLHHALMLSRKLLAREKGGARQILLITDGEPTAHLEGDRSFFSYPPSYKTLSETLKEVRRCTREDIRINTFMLENSYQLVNFVDRITRINRGRAFYSAPDRLGEYVLVDYVSNRRKWVAA